MTETRIRGVPLDPMKVRQIAGRFQIASATQLEWHYCRHHKIYVQRDGTAKKAWSGRKNIEVTKAQMLAESLQLDGYEHLLRNDSPKSPWDKLIKNESYHGPFLDFIDISKPDRRLVSFDDSSERDKLDQVPIDTQWQLKLRGSQGYSVFILLRSENRFFQLAPIEKENHKHIFNSDILNYPEKGHLRFNQNDGVGWRELIAIRANRIPINIRGNDTGYDCTLNELELFARRLEGINNNNIAISRYEFMLIPPNSSSTFD